MLAIKRLRKARNMTQGKLAEASGVSQPYISQLEKGQKTNPSMEKLEKIAGALGSTVSEMMKTEGENEHGIGGE